MFGFLNDPTDNSLDQKSYKPYRGRFYFFWNCIKTSGRPVLIALMAGAAAHSVEETNNDSLVEEVTGRLAMAFAPKKVPSPTEVIVTRWRKDPFARGSYSYVGPKTQQGDYNAMSKAVGRIHFAGEATCGTHPATVHGAYISGLRAASEVIENLLGPIRIPDPLIPRKAKAEVPTPPVFTNPNGTKHKKGYVDVWEPILPPPPPTTNDTVNAEAEAYEAKVIFAILKELGPRPVKPDRMGVNPYLMFTKDEWYKMKAKCDAEKVAMTGNPNAKAGRDEIRVALGHAWRTASEEIKRPYIEQCENARNSNANFNEKVKLWDAKAARIRKEFIENNPPPTGVRGSFQGPSAIEIGSGRKGRKLSGYEE
jgi:lysine-specific histone demethylase 1